MDKIISKKEIPLASIIITGVAAFLILGLGVLYFVGFLNKTNPEFFIFKQMHNKVVTPADVDNKFALELPAGSQVIKQTPEQVTFLLGDKYYSGNGTGFFKRTLNVVEINSNVAYSSIDENASITDLVLKKSLFESWLYLKLAIVICVFAVIMVFNFHRFSLGFHGVPFQGLFLLIFLLLL